MGDLEAELLAFEELFDEPQQEPNQEPNQEPRDEEQPFQTGPEFEDVGATGPTIDYSSTSDYDPANPDMMYADDPAPPLPDISTKVQVVYGASAKIDIPEPPLKKARTMPPGFDRKKKKKASAKKEKAPTVQLPAHLAAARQQKIEEALPIVNPQMVVSKPPAPPTEPIVLSNIDIVEEDAVPATSDVGKKALEANEKRIYLRKAAGKIWNDMSLQEWPDNDYRIFCGDLGNEVNDSTLAKVFVKYASFAKAKVIRNKRTQKTKGYGFVSFLDPFDATTALKEMQGCYVGNRPIKLRKSKWAGRNYAAKGNKLGRKKSNHM